MTEPGVELATRFYRSFRAHDWPETRACFAEDVELGFAGRGPLAGDHRGAEAALAVLRDLVDRSGGTFRPVLDDGWDVCVSAHHVVVFDWFRAEVGDQQLRAYLYFVMAIEGDRIVRMFVHSSEQYEFDGFFAGG